MTYLPRVVIESPYAPRNGRTLESNIAYARAALRDSIDRGEAPFASHLLYTQVLDDTDPAERQKGIRLNYEYIKYANLVAVYTDLEISIGMQGAIDCARMLNIPVKFRRLYD